MDKKSGLLVITVWLVPMAASARINEWWMTCFAGVFSLIMGVFLMVYPKTRTARTESILMIVVGVLWQGLAIAEFHVRSLSK